MGARLVELIEVEEREGRGVEGDPVRLVTRWYTKDGELVAERDKWKEQQVSGNPTCRHGVDMDFNCNGCSDAAAMGGPPDPRK